jgi:hypothetical protein
MLTAQDIHDAFMELGTRVRREGKIIDLAIYGGSALMEARISGRLRLGIQALWRVKDTPTQEGRHAAPAYLGRGRPAP